MEKNKMIIFGATGNVGTELVKLLKKKGKRFKLAVRDIHKAKQIFGEDVELVKFDFEKANTTNLNELFKDVDRMFLLRPPTVLDVKNHILPLIQAAKAADIQHLVYLSVMGVQFNPLSPHYKIEKYIKASNIPFTILRANVFMQNFNTFFIESIKDDHMFFVPAGNGKTSFVDVRDIAQVVLKVTTREIHKNKIYTLTGSEALNYSQVANIFSEVLKKKISYPKPSTSHYKKQMLSLGIPAPIVQVMSNVYLNVRLGMTKTVTNDIEKIIENKPYTLKEYVEAYANVWN